MANVKADIIRNLRSFFACKSIKHYVFRKTIFNIKDPDIKAVRFGANVNKVSLYSLMYIKSHNKLEKCASNILEIDHTDLAMP